MELRISAKKVAVATESGSKYFFEVLGDVITYRKGLKEGIVIRFVNRIEPGEKLRFICRDFNMSNQLDDDETVVQTTKIVKVEAMA